MSKYSVTTLTRTQILRRMERVRFNFQLILPAFLVLQTYRTFLAKDTSQSKRYRETRTISAPQGYLLIDDGVSMRLWVELFS